jgi:hypothetical protein
VWSQSQIWLDGGGQLTAFQEAKLNDPGVVALLAPYHACPWTLERTLLVNEVYDGGKWTCGVREMADRAEGAPPCIVYAIFCGIKAQVKIFMKRRRVWHI